MSPSAKLNPSRIDQARLAGIETAMPPAPADGAWPTEVLLFTQIPVEEALEWQRDAAEAMLAGTAPGHRLLLTEHPATMVGGIPGEMPLDWKALRTDAIELDEVFLPGMMTVWLTLDLSHWSGDAAAARSGIDALIARVLKDFDIDAAPWEFRSKNELTMVAPAGQDNRQIAGGKIAAPGRIAQVHFSIFTNIDGNQFEAIGLRDTVSMVDLGMAVHRQAEVRESLLRHYEAIFQSAPVIPQRTGVRTAKPPWLRVKLPLTNATQPVHDIVKERGLHTVCESARCPNQGECWGHGTATFMINGDVCTRSCSFCAVFTGRPKPIDPDEPRRVAEAARLMGLKYSVVTAVNRDELKDGGAGQFAATIRELRAAIPGIRVETLIPDFRGDEEALDLVLAERPDVLNHNIETVPRLYSRVRPQADYEQSLEVLARAKAAGLVAKSGFMLGLGEEEDEIAALLKDLRKAGVDIVTIGQYLRPSDYHHPVVRYATPAEFARWKEFGMGLGFQTVQSGPLVRSSYHAHESFAGGES